MRENEIAVKEIIEEILPLLKDGFVAKCLSCGNRIVMIFPSGQTVMLDVAVA